MENELPPSTTSSIPSGTAPTTEVHAQPPAPRARKPALWPTMVVLFGIMPIAVVISGIVSVVAVVVSGHWSLRDGTDELTNALAEFASTPLGLIVIFVPGQLIMLAGALVPAAFSSEPLLRRVGLVRPRISFTTLILVVLGTFGVEELSGLIGSLFGESSEQLQWLEKLLTTTTGATAVFMVLLLSILPGFCEELFFRGFVLTRLLARWKPGNAIALSAIMFGVAHGDPQHGLLVVPLGVWAGFVAWKTRSVVLPMVLHGLNNLVGILFARAFAQDDIEGMELSATGLGIMLALCACTLLAIRALIREARERENAC